MEMLFSVIMAGLTQDQMGIFFGTTLIVSTALIVSAAFLAAIAMQAFWSTGP